VQQLRLDFGLQLTESAAGNSARRHRGRLAMATKKAAKKAKKAAKKPAKKATKKGKK
jgi:hypothetical protein